VNNELCDKIDPKIFKKSSSSLSS